MIEERVELVINGFVLGTEICAMNKLKVPSCSSFHLTAISRSMHDFINITINKLLLIFTIDFFSGLSLVIIGISAVVCVITTLSLSAICTNGEVKGGELYN